MTLIIQKPVGAKLVLAKDYTPFPSLLSGVVAWWDASDASTFTYSSGTSVSAWNSIVGSYSLTQGTALNQPSRSGTVNGLSSVVFDGSNDSLSVANFDLTPGGQAFSVWAVLTATSGANRVIAEQSTDFNNVAGAFLLIRSSVNKVDLNKRGAGVGDYSGFTSDGTLTTTAKAIVASHNGALSTDETELRLNASTAGTRPFNNNTNSNNVINTLFVGARAGTSLYLNGQICELGFTTTVLTAAEVQGLERYLIDKWGT